MTTIPFKIRRYLIDRFKRRELPAVARDVMRQHLTYLTEAKFLSMRDAIERLKSEGVRGDFVEYGIALGGSAIYLSSEIGAKQRFHGYDLFGMIPAPGENDDEKSKARYEIIRSGQSQGIGGDTYYGYQDKLFHRVCENFESFGYPIDGTKIVLHRGLFEDTVRFEPGYRIALAHLDCDWYEPVKLCLERTAEVLSSGGFMILDDYNDYVGCRKAADQFLATHPGFTLVRNEPHAVIRCRPLE